MRISAVKNLRGLIVAAIVLVTLAMPGNCNGQEIPPATDVIEEYVEALGGEMSINSLTSFKLTGTYMGKEFIVHYHEGTMCWFAFGGTYAYWVDAQRRFWQRQEGEISLRDDLSPGYPSGFINLPTEAVRWLNDDQLKVTNLGAENLDGVATWRLLFEVEGQDSAERLFDQESGLLLQTRWMGSKTGIKSYEYTRLDDQLFATTTNLDGVILTFQKLEIDPDHGDLDFSIPKELEQQWQKNQQTESNNSPDRN